MRRPPVAAVIAAAFLLGGCRHAESIVNPPPGSSSKGVYVVDEGSFYVNGSLSYYDAQHDTLYRFVTAAESSWLFPNDMRMVRGKGYIAVNGSNLIDVLDTATHQVTKAISDPAGPGFLAAGGGGLYAANYDGTVSRIDPLSDSLTGTSAKVVGFPGGIAFAAGRIFVSDIGLYPAVGEWLKVLDAASLAQVDSVRLGGAPGQMALLGGRLFVVATASSRVYEVQPSALTVGDSVHLAGYASDITTDGSSLYVLESDSVAKLAPDPLRVENGGYIVRSVGLYFYSMAADTATGELYLGTVTGADGSGVLEIYSAAAVRKSPPLPVGVFPGAYAFR